MKLFTKTHEWFYENEDGEVYIGVSDYAVDQLGDIVYVELPYLEDHFECDDDLAEIESVKSTSTIFSPVEGEVVAVNEQLEEHPEIINDDPMGEGWLVKLSVSKEIDKDEYMTKEEYDSYVKEL